MDTALPNDDSHMDPSQAAIVSCFRRAFNPQLDGVQGQLCYVTPRAVGVQEEPDGDGSSNLFLHHCVEHLMVDLGLDALIVEKFKEKFDGALINHDHSILYFQPPAAHLVFSY